MHLSISFSRTYCFIATRCYQQVISVFISFKKKNSTLGASATNQIILNSKRVKQIILFIEAFFFLRERSVSHTPCALGLIEYELI